MMSSLSDRVRPGSEAAPWVVEGIKILEADVERLTKERDKWHDSWKALHDERQELRGVLGVPIPLGEGTVIQEFGPRYPLLESARMVVKERDEARADSARLRADFPPAPPLPVLNCKCYACEYLRRKQAEARISKAVEDGVVFGEEAKVAADVSRRSMKKILEDEEKK
jgi:hypothetical protein